MDNCHNTHTCEVVHRDALGARCAHRARTVSCPRRRPSNGRTAGQGICAIPLDAAGTAPAAPPAAPPVLVASDRLEGAYVLRQAAADTCSSRRATAVAMRTRLPRTGRAIDVAHRPVNRPQGHAMGGGALILAGDDTRAGPGRNSVIAGDAGNDGIVCHAVPRDTCASTAAHSGARACSMRSAPRRVSGPTPPRPSRRSSAESPAGVPDPASPGCRAHCARRCWRCRPPRW